MATILTPSQMAAHVDLLLDPLRYYERMVLLHEHCAYGVAQTAEPQHNLEHLDWKLPCPTPSLSPLEKPPHD